MQCCPLRYGASWCRMTSAEEHNSASHHTNIEYQLSTPAHVGQRTAECICFSLLGFRIKMKCRHSYPDSSRFCISSLYRVSLLGVSVWEEPLGVNTEHQDELRCQIEGGRYITYGR